MRVTVEIYGKPCEVSVHRTGKTVWQASGKDWKGKDLFAKARSEASALKKWQELAEWRYRMD